MVLVVVVVVRVSQGYLAERYQHTVLDIKRHFLFIVCYYNLTGADGYT